MEIRIEFSEINLRTILKIDCDKLENIFEAFYRWIKLLHGFCMTRILWLVFIRDYFINTNILGL
ncbi:hypothetical protein BpHYR1_044700 [Brachionus plicatilis]|uniref:Uncharacterized protein n=1 Tax=Brachionus plicatilis TaxID=10195 RepID=A0A3M7PM77_BRAPC|nr:hypothetical protein BpHYR1_044700 [Brachionus plicatilis]